MLSWEERSRIIDVMQALRLNTYLYAPKEDPYHRREWRTPYPREWTAEFTSFVKNGCAAGISVVPGIAPGLSFDYCSKDDYFALIRKCGALAKTGPHALCLLMDDIPARLPQSCEKEFPSLGNAHGLLLARLKADLKKTYPGVGLWFCPTVYADELIGSDKSSSSYLSDLAASMPHSVPVLWTGPHVISRALSVRSLSRISKLFHGNVCIWDNLYANDYCPRRLFWGPYKNRSAGIMSVTRGVLLNPTGLVHTDMFLLSLLSGLLRKARPKKTWASVVEKLPFARELKIVAPFFDLPQSVLAKAALAPKNLERVKIALKKLVWEWKSPLQREWYPFLYSLESDIKLLECPAGQKRQSWIRKKCPLVLADILLKR